MTTIDSITLASGGHQRPEEGMCLLEAASFVAGERFSDRPECVSAVLGSFGRSLNDVLPDDKRQQLVPLISRIIGTRNDSKDERRSYLALDWLIRTHLPAFLDLAAQDHAAKVRTLAPIVDPETARAAAPVVHAARAAIQAATGLAAGAAVRAAVWSAAGDAAWDAAWAAAGDAASATARAAARAAAGDAAEERLAPTVASLQDSAIALFAERLIDAHEVENPENGSRR